MRKKSGAFSRLFSFLRVWIIYGSLESNSSKSKKLKRRRRRIEKFFVIPQSEILHTSLTINFPTGKKIARWAQTAKVKNGEHPLLYE